MLKQIVLAASCGLLAPMWAGAASIAINPGMWETTMTRDNPMTGQTTTETTRECVTETEFDPRDMMEDAQGCTLDKEELVGDELSFVMSCQMQGGQARMEGAVRSDGDTSSGRMRMNVSVGGMDMSMNMNWAGRRLGDC